MSDYTPAEIEFIQCLYDRYSENGGTIDLPADGPAFIAIVRKHNALLLAEREREVREDCAKVAENGPYYEGDVADGIRQTIPDDPTP